MAEWGTHMFGWASVLVVLVAMGINVSFFVGADWTTGVVYFISGWIRALSVPVEHMPTLILACIFVAFVFYNVGYYICFFEEDPDDVAAEQEQPGFIGKHYHGKPGETIQMVIAIRGDLGLSPGKIALQCGHATVGIYRRIWQKNRGLIFTSCDGNGRQIKSWEDAGQPKVVLKLDSEPALLEVQTKAKRNALPTYIVRDKRPELVDGELLQGRRTAIVVLGPPSVLEEAVGDLALLD